ncbi:MAG: response regulator [bacterium]|nr:response regulator [Gammaproteobacteria bacterium]HIL97865.1 response regulator [Pseudomonadales bacterium]
MHTAKLKLLIVDDEAPAGKKIARQLSNHSQVEIIGEARDGVEALQLIDEKKPDVVLLDIQMPGMTGFDVVRLMQAPRPQVIFVTAYDEYATRAFEVAAIDYLLKPVSDARLIQSLDRVRESASDSAPDASAVLDVLEQPSYAKRLAVRHLKRVRLVQTSDINYITSEHRVVYVYDRLGNKHWTNETLDQLSRRLDPQQFCRVHRSSIVNLSASFEIEPWDDGRLKLHFPDDTILTVAREPAIALRKVLGF